MWYLIILGIIIFVVFLIVIFYNPSEYIDAINNKKLKTAFSNFGEYSLPVRQLENLTKADVYSGELQEPLPRDSAGGRNENRCRVILEKLYPGHKFHTVRPDWLKNPKTNRNLELDMYCHKLRLACEYDGEQHVRKTKFHKNNSEVTDQFRRDEYKQNRCKELGITLIRVPYQIKPVEFEPFIINLLKKAGKFPLN